MCNADASIRVTFQSLFFLTLFVRKMKNSHRVFIAMLSLALNCPPFFFFFFFDAGIILG